MKKIKVTVEVNKAEIDLVLSLLESCVESQLLSWEREPLGPRGTEWIDRALALPPCDASYDIVHVESVYRALVQQWQEKNAPTRQCSVPADQKAWAERRQRSAARKATAEVRALGIDPGSALRDGVRAHFEAAVAR